MFNSTPAVSGDDCRQLRTCSLQIYLAVLLCDHIETVLLGHPLEFGTPIPQVYFYRTVHPTCLDRV